MQIVIYDQTGNTVLERFSARDFEDLTFTKESPYGWMDASFKVPVLYQSYQPYAQHYNRVEVYDASELVWSGLIYGVGRSFSGGEVTLQLEAVGWVAKLGMLTTTTNLAAEKGSTYITDHILGDSILGQYITAGLIDTGDYSISATRDYSARKTFREIMDDILSFNAYDWQVHDRSLYFQPVETNVSYFTTAEYIKGSIKQDLSDFANKVYYSYKTTGGVLTTGSVTDAVSGLPETHKVVSLGDGISAAESTVLANLHLDGVKTLRSSSGITVSRIWGTDGNEVPLTQVEAGKIIRIEDVAVNPTTLSAAYAENDTDTFRVAQVKYSNEAKTVTLSPGKPASRLPVILARMGLNR